MNIDFTVAVAKMKIEHQFHLCIVTGIAVALFENLY